MPKFSLLSLHQQGEEDIFSIPAEEKELPSSGHLKVAFDALLLKHIFDYLESRLSLGLPVGAQQAVEIFSYLRINSYIFSKYENFPAEHFAAVKLELQEKNQETPSTEMVLKAFQQGIISYFANSKEKLALFYQRHGEAHQAYLERVKNHTANQKGYWLEHPQPHHNKALQELGVTPANNKQAPEDYVLASLSAAFPRFAKKKAAEHSATDFFQENFSNQDPLLHVRNCEDPQCSMHPAKAEPLFNTLAESAEQFINNYSDKEQNFVYAGFASGLLRRDLNYLNRLIESGHQKITCLFIDPAYKKLIAQLRGEATTVTVVEQAEIDILSKGMRELAVYLSSKFKGEFAFHYFSDTEEAIQWLAAIGLKIHLLTAEDIFVDGGALCAEVATDGAHADLTRLVETSLATKGAFFELIKDDNNQKIYFQERKSNSNFLTTHVYSTHMKQTQTFFGSSLKYFLEEKKSKQTPIYYFGKSSK